MGLQFATSTPSKCYVQQGLFFPPKTRNEWGKRLAGIAQQVSEAAQGRDGVAGSGPNHLVVPMTVPPEILSIHVSPREQSESWWTMSTGGSLPGLTEKRLQREITKKSRLASIYWRRAEELWLILALGPRHSSVFSLGDSPALDAEYVSAFTRVFVVPCYSRVLYELKVASP